MERLRDWMRKAGDMGGLAKLQLMIGLGAMGLVATAGVVGYTLLAGGDSEEAPIVEASPTPEATAPSAAAPSGAPLGDSFRMIIEKLDVDAPVATYGLDERSVPIVPTGADAAEVVAWYDFSARPGSGGNAVFAGHVTWNGDAVFKELNTLAEGDTVRLLDDRGGEVVYRVTQNFTVDPNDPESVKVMYPTEHDEATIITCGGEFFENDDPVAGGDYTRRVIIKAELVSISRAPV